MDAETRFTLAPLKTAIGVAIIGVGAAGLFDWLTNNPAIAAAVGVLAGAAAILAVVRKINRKPQPPADPP